MDGVVDLIVGTAQWGKPYGILGQGKADETDLRELLAVAEANGVAALDTASAYESEDVIGRINSSLPVHTKLAPDVRTADDVRTSVGLSLENLRRDQLDLLMLHRGDWSRFDGWQALEDLRDDGVARRLGVSARSPSEAWEALEHPIDAVQAAISILDQRLPRAGFLQAAQDAGVDVHARSIFLQGVAFDSHSGPWKPVCEQITEFAARQNVDPAAVWSSYVKQLPVKALVVGFIHPSQLCSFLEHPTVSDIQAFADALPSIDASWLDPRTWRAA